MLTYNNGGSCGFLIDIKLISQTERTSYRATVLPARFPSSAAASCSSVDQQKKGEIIGIGLCVCMTLRGERKKKKKKRNVRTTVKNSAEASRRRGARASEWRHAKGGAAGAIAAVIA